MKEERLKEIIQANAEELRILHTRIHGTLKLRNRVHEMLVQKKTRDDVAKMLQTEFHWVQLHLDRGLDGAMAELQ